MMDIKDIDINKDGWKIKGTDYGIVWINGTRFREIKFSEVLTDSKSTSLEDALQKEDERLRKRIQRDAKQNIKATEDQSCIIDLKKQIDQEKRLRKFWGKLAFEAQDEARRLQEIVDDLTKERWQ